MQTIGSVSLYHCDVICSGADGEDADLPVEARVCEAKQCPYAYVRSGDPYYYKQCLDACPLGTSFFDESVKTKYTVGKSEYQRYVGCTDSCSGAYVKSKFGNGKDKLQCVVKCTDFGEAYTQYMEESQDTKTIKQCVQSCGNGYYRK